MAYNVLIADDENMIRRIVARSLSLAYGDQLRIHEAPDGLTALEVISANSIDLLITDMNMPGKTGLEVIAEAQKISPGTKYLIMSCRAREYREKAKQLGVETIEKPFDVQALKEAVARTLPLQNK